MAAAQGNVNAAVAAAIQAQTDFGNVLRNICAFTQRQVDVLINDGYNTADALYNWKFNDIREWCELKSKISAARGGASYGDRKIKCLQAMAWWITDRELRGIPFNIVLDFSIVELQDAIEEARLEYEESKRESAVELPKTFTVADWVTWEESVYNYFTSHKNNMNVPYAYVIRKDTPPVPVGAMDREMQMIYAARLNGNQFDRDSKYVHNILKQLTNGTDAATWMKGTRCGRDAMKALQTHYDGTAEGERRMEAAQGDLTRLFYKNETTFSFEKYVTKMKECHDVLMKYGKPKYESDKISDLLDKINCTDAEVKTHVSIVRNTCTTFATAATEMATHISRIFPSSHPSSGRYKKRKIASLGGGRGRGRGGGRGGQGRGRGGRGRGGGGRGRGGGGQTENGIDISDPCRWYDEHELSALSDETRRSILNHPDRAAAIAARKRNRRNTSGVSTGTGTGNGSNESAVPTTRSEREIFQAATINGIMNAMNHSRVGTPVNYPGHGNRRTSAANRGPPAQISTNSNDAASVITYDHLGNPVE